MSRFRTCLGRVLQHEGGFADHAEDPGGATMQGVTQAVYDRWRRNLMLPPQSVAKITRPELEEIYREGYWSRVRADELPPGVDYVAFDAAVNSGPSRSVKWLQQAAGLSGRDVDGVVGPQTLAAVRARHPANLIEAACDVRMRFLRQLSHWPTFGRGWTSRVNDVEDAALRDAGMASERPVDGRKPVQAPEAPKPAPGPLARLWAALCHWWRYLR